MGAKFRKLGIDASIPAADKSEITTGSGPHSSALAAQCLLRLSATPRGAGRSGAVYVMTWDDCRQLDGQVQVRLAVGQVQVRLAVDCNKWISGQEIMIRAINHSKFTGSTGTTAVG